ncbi:hypothetical protein [Micromonospora sp. NPDC004704]
MTHIGPCVAVGDVLDIAPLDYRGEGSSPLRMRVLRLPEGADTPGLEWVNLLGVVVEADGSDGRYVLPWVRVSALREMRERADPPTPPPPVTVRIPSQRSGGRERAGLRRG